MIRLLFALALLSFAAALPAQEAVPDGQALFAARLPGLDGKPVDMARYRGRPLVVNFWARWCVPCREEMPALTSRAARAKGGGVAVLGIALEDKPEPVRDFARAYEIGYPILLAADQGIELLRALGNPQAGLPFTVAYDHRGRLVFRKLGRLQPADLDAAFAAAAQP